MAGRPYKRLTDKGIDQATRLLDSWAGKLTWERYLAVLETEIGHRYTKAAMLRHPRIASAWGDAKIRCRETVAKAGHGSVALRLAQAKAAKLTNQVSRLTKENEQLLEQFVRWSHNATIRGVSPEELDAPLPRKPGRD